MRRAGIFLLVVGLLVSPLLVLSSVGQSVPDPIPWSNYAQDYASDKHLDPTFGTGGKLMTGLRANGTAGIALQKDGRIIVASHNLVPSGGSLLLRLLPTGAYDPTFGEGGRVSTIILDGGESEVPDIQAVALQDDGKIVVAGMAVRYSDPLTPPISPMNFYLARFNSNGLPDLSFGEGGSLIWSLQRRHYGLAVAVQNDGRILFAGGSEDQHSNNRRFAFYRFSPRGEMEADFGSASGPFNANAPTGFALDALVQPDGKIVLSGGRNFLGAAASTDFILARYNPDGSPDDGGPQDSTPGAVFGVSGIVETDFGRPKEQAFSLALQPTAGGLKLLAAGCSSTHQCLYRTGFVDYERRIAQGEAPGKDWDAGAEGKVAMARYNLEDGSLDPTFSAGDEPGKFDEMDGGASSMSVHSDGTIAATIKRTASMNTPAADFEVARFLADGSPDAAFGIDGVVTTKEFTAATAPWGPGVPNPNYENMSQRVVIQPDGRILVGGESNGGGFTGHELVMARYVTAPTILDPDLSISMTDSPDPVTSGENLEYRIQVENHAVTPALGVGLMQSIPPGLSVLSITSDHGGCAESQGQVTCSFGALLGAEKANVKVTALVGSDAGPVLRTTAEVASGAYRKTATAETTVGRPSGKWTMTGNIAEARTAHTATLLGGLGCGTQCGKVLVAGGRSNAGALSSAELYDPLSGAWSPTGSLNSGRFGHTATLLPDGKVMVAGGASTTQQGITSVEMYDPVTGMWTNAQPLAAPRYGHTATLLKNGKVLIAGGQGAPNSLSETEIYTPGVLTVDPNAPGITRTGVSESTGKLEQGRSFFTATLLPDGKVLAVGGFRGPKYEIDDPGDPDDSGGPYGKAEVYDPVTGKWAGAANNGVGRWRHSGTSLRDGRVLIAGGNVTTGGAIPTTSAELYNPSTNAWAPAGSLVTARLSHTANLLPDGKVLVAGGRGREPAGQAIRTAELFDPATDSWKATDIMHFARYDHTTTLMTGPAEACGERCGKVLATGGTGERTGAGNGDPQQTAEYYTPPVAAPIPPPPPPPPPGPEKNDPNGGLESQGKPPAPPLPAAVGPNPPPPAGPGGLPSTAALSASNPVPGTLGGPAGLSSVLQGSAAAAGASTTTRGQAEAPALPALPAPESRQEPEPSERWAMVGSAPANNSIWFFLAGLALLVTLGCFMAGAGMVGSRRPEPSFAFAAGKTGR